MRIAHSDATEPFNNTALAGGAIHNHFVSSSVTLHGGATVHQNSASNAGGGLYNNGTATLSNVTLQGNSGTYGGGLDNRGGTATLMNVTLQGNSASNAGGGISNHTLSGTHLSLTNVVIADSGAAGNCSEQAPDSASFSLSTDTSCTLSGAGNRTNTPALLGPLQDNGGNTLTLLPQSGSPLIDGGQCTPGITTDQRGVPRPQGAACDIGAVEVGGVPVFLPLVQG